MLVYKLSAKFSKAQSSMLSLKFGKSDDNRGQTEFIEKELGENN